MVQEMVRGLRQKVKERARRGVARILGKIFGKGEDDPIGSWGGRDPEELTRQYVKMSEDAGAVEVGTTVRPRASRTTGARFDHYEVLTPPASGRWDLAPGLQGTVAKGRGLMKEVLFLAIVEDGQAGIELEALLAVLHPHLDPQYIVAVARARQGDLGPFYLGEVEVTAPALPLILAFGVPTPTELHFKSASVGQVDGEEKLRSVLVDTLMRGSPHGPRAGGVCAQLSGTVVRLQVLSAATPTVA